LEDFGPLGTAGDNPASFLAGLIAIFLLFVANERGLEPRSLAKKKRMALLFWMGYFSSRSEREKK